MVARRIPLVSVGLVLDVGEARLSDDQSGRALLVGNALQGGTENYSGADLAEAIEGIGASLSVSTHWDATRIGTSVLADRLPEALDLLAEVALRPSFPDSEVARTRDQRLATIQQERTDPSRMAELAFRGAVYADGAAYHRAIGGTQTSVEAFDAGAARALYQEAYGPSLGIVAAGDLDPAEFKAHIEQRFGTWEGGWERSTPPLGPAQTTTRRVVVVDRPHAVQSEIRIGHVGPPRTIEDYLDLRVFNGALGGVFGSRLNLNLREKNGFTYGVRSRLAFGRGPGPFGISTAVETAVMAAAVRETMVEFTGLVQDGPTEEEVESIRDFMSGVFPLQMQSTGQMAQQVSGLLIYDLPLDYFQSYRDRIRAVTVESAARAGRRHLHPEQAQIVIVGDASAVVADLEALDLGPVEVVSSS